MQEPPKIIPKDASDYLRVMTRAVFQAGFGWKVIENKWPGFESAFDSFDPYKVSTYNETKISELRHDKRIVRNVAIIEATIHNAQAIVDTINEFGDFKKYLDSVGDFESAVKEIRKTFKWLGDLGTYYFLWVVSQPVPSYEDWCKSRGIKSFKT